LNEYKTEGFELFQNLLTKLREQVTAHLIRVEVVKKDQLSAENNETVAKNNKNPTNENQINPETVKEWGKVGRNELCPCGSGKKYKHCHGKMN
jgi:preprotein translocase subunit SecA